MAFRSSRLTRTGLRALAAFEAGKGLLVVAAGLGLLALVHRDAQHAAEELVRHMHLDPARHYPRIFIAAAGHLHDTQLLLLAAGAFVYAALRLVEAYGLWQARHWAEWIAIGSGALYLPVELFELVRHPTPFHALVLLTNLAIVLWVLYLRLSGRDELAK